MQDMMDTLALLGYEIVKCDIPCSDYETDLEFTMNLEKMVTENDCDYIFTFNFFPIIAKMAEKLKIRYISWIYDSPHWTLYSPAVKGKYNYIFVFDYVQYLEVKKLEVSNVFYFPLAVNVDRLEKQLGQVVELDKCGERKHVDYINEISFVGSLYENNLYDKLRYLPDYLKGYLEGIMQMQEKVYGYNFVSELLDDQIMNELCKYVVLNLEPSYFWDKRAIYADMVNAKITARERTTLLQRLAELYSVTLYTASDVSMIKHVKLGGIVSYQKDMPKVFRTSKINLNMTLRSIQSGIPLRVLDIMGAGGFLLSNYQRELAQQFTDGKELVLYGSEEELLYYVDYYLNHEEEREEIAYHGFRKVREKFAYAVRVKKMMSIVNGTSNDMEVFV